MSWIRRHSTWVSVIVLGLLAYVPALTAAPGRMPSDSKLYIYLDPGRFLVRHDHDDGSPAVRRVGSSSTHRLSLADGSVVLAVRTTRRARLDRPSPVDRHAPRRRRPRRAVDVTRDRARSTRSPRRRAGLPAVALRAPVHLAHLGAPAPLGRPRMDRRVHGVGGHSGPLAVPGRNRTHRADGRCGERDRAGDDHPGARTLADPRGVAARHHVDACSDDLGQGGAAVDDGVAVVDRDADDPGALRRRRAGVLRIARVRLVHVDVDRGGQRARLLAVLHPRLLRRRPRRRRSTTSHRSRSSRSASHSSPAASSGS